MEEVKATSDYLDSLKSKIAEVFESRAQRRSNLSDKLADLRQQLKEEFDKMILNER